MTTESTTKRLSFRQMTLLRAALEAHRHQLSQSRDYKGANAVRQLIASLPRELPYDVTLTPADWAIVSKALRRGGPNPEPGSVSARWLALYQTLRGLNYFYRMRGETPPRQWTAKRR